MHQNLLPNWQPSCSTGLCVFGFIFFNDLFHPRRWVKGCRALGALSRQQQLMEPPGRSWLPVLAFTLPGLSPPLPSALLHSSSRSLPALTAPSPSKGPPTHPTLYRMRLSLVPRRQSSPNYRCKSDPYLQAPFSIYPALETHEEDKTRHEHPFFQSSKN